MLGLCTYATKPDKNCTTYTAQLLQHSMAKYKVQPERSAASKQLVYAFCAGANMASQQCVKTIMNIIQVLWRTAPTVAVPARAREPENSAPTDLQEGYKIDKYMYVYKRKKIQLIHVTMDNTYIMLDAKLFLYVLQHSNRHTRHMYAHTHTHTHRMYACTNIRHMYACTHTDTHTRHMYACTHTHTHTHVACMHAHTHTRRMYAHTHTLHVCMHTHTLHVCMHTHTSHVCMHTHTHRLCSSNPQSSKL